MRIGQIAIDITPLRENRDFRLLFTGRFISMAGNAVATTAANWQIYALTRSSLAVGLLTLANSAGMFAGLMAGGMLADRHDRRKLMLNSRAPLAALAALLMVNSLLSHPQLWVVYTLVLAIGALSGLGSPAATAAVPAIVPAASIPAAAALNAMGSQLGQLGGPALAGVLIAGPGLAWCYGIDAACFAIFGATLWFISPLPPTVRAGRPGFRSMAEGLRYVTRNSVVGGMLAVDTSAMIFGMPSALFPAMARDALPRWLGDVRPAGRRPGIRRDDRRRDERLDRQAAPSGRGRDHRGPGLGRRDRRLRAERQPRARPGVPGLGRHG